MSLTNEEKERMLDELFELIAQPRREDFPQPNFTVREYGTRKELSYRVSYETLEKAVEAGTLERKHGVSVHGKACNLYWKAGSSSGRSDTLAG